MLVDRTKGEQVWRCGGGVGGRGGGGGGSGGGGCGGKVVVVDGVTDAPVRVPYFWFRAGTLGPPTFLPKQGRMIYSGDSYVTYFEVSCQLWERT